MSDPRRGGGAPRAAAATAAARRRRVCRKVCRISRVGAPRSPRRGERAGPTRPILNAAAHPLDDVFFMLLKIGWFGFFVVFHIFENFRNLVAGNFLIIRTILSSFGDVRRLFTAWWGSAR